ncbi:MAG TPA: phage terminase large subunit [Micromonosporaceae bacterium]
MDISAQAWEAFLAHWTPKSNAWSTPGKMARSLDAKTVQTPALDLIDAALVEVADGKCDRLIISMPPQEGKSQRASRRFPTWCLVRNPDMRIVNASYEHGVARRWGRAVRNDIQAHPELGLVVRSDTKAAHEWQLDGHEGGMYCAGVGGALTGRPVDLLIIDDPVKGPKEADSPTYRDAVWDWWESVASTRLAPGAPVVLIMTRWHEDDLAGRLIRDEPGRWKVLNIPAQAEHRPEYGETDPLGREPGEYMLSARGRTTEQWERIRTERGSRVWSALYQGRPSPGEGLIFRREWWQRYETPQWIDDNGERLTLTFDEVIQSWDMSFKDTDSADFVVGQVWGRRGGDAYLLDQVRGRMSFVDTCMAVRQLSAKWPQSNAKLVEDKANGPAVISSLSRTVSGLIAVQPEGSKESRASAISPFVEAKNVYLPAPELAPWVGELIDEAASFPLSTHDDQVDALSQALSRLLLNAVRPRVRFLT